MLSSPYLVEAVDLVKKVDRGRHAGGDGEEDGAGQGRVVGCVLSKHAIGIVMGRMKLSVSIRQDTFWRLLDQDSNRCTPAICIAVVPRLCSQ